ncbi:hydroxyacyl-thioester dehydratase type 2, mitochondrial [Monosporozyma unispora]|nr:hypothetical protein C6P44_003422 [Kazachstania unispora]
MERIFKDVVSKLRVNQFSQINGLKQGTNPGITDYLLSFSPIENPLSKDGYYAYLDPWEVDKKFMKNGPFTRRLWGGGSMKLYSALQYDRVYFCVEKMKRIRETSGVVFMTLERNVLNKIGTFPILKELRTLAYTNVKPNISANVFLPNTILESGKLITTIEFNEENIIKYNILSSNPHRIHWDKNYCITKEGYKNIIVPGPYILQLATNLIEHYVNFKLTNIKYRNVNFIYPNTQLSLCCDSTLKIFWLSNKIKPNLIYFILNIND